MVILNAKFTLTRTCVDAWNLLVVAHHSGFENTPALMLLHPPCTKPTVSNADTYARSLAATDVLDPSNSSMP